MKLFFRRMKYCWQKRDERVAVHCSLFAVNFCAMKKYFVFVDETATPTQILYTAYGKKPVRETWQTPFILLCLDPSRKRRSFWKRKERGISGVVPLLWFTQTAVSQSHLNVQASFTARCAVIA